MYELTDRQKLVIVDLIESGHSWIAESTRRAWQKGETSYIDRRVSVPRGLRGRFNAANHDTEKQAAMIEQGD